MGLRDSGLLGVAAFALGVATGCSAEPSRDVAADLGCSAVDGLAVLTGEQPPAYVLIGEANETKEAPSAFAELACQLAARQPPDQPLWVGLPDYIGGTTEAEHAMRKRLKDLIAKGAPMVIGASGDGHTIGASRREEAEQRWADAIKTSVATEHAGRALLLVSRKDGMAATMIAETTRIEDYTPMPLFLPEGEMINLEFGQATGVGAPTVRIYLKPKDGYAGQLALAKLTPAQKIPDTK